MLPGGKSQIHFISSAFYASSMKCVILIIIHNVIIGNIRAINRRRISRIKQACEIEELTHWKPKDRPGGSTPTRLSTTAGGHNCRAE